MTIDVRSQLTDLIVNKLNDNKEQLKEQFFCNHPIKIARHFTLDNLLPSEIAEQIYANFPKPNQMHLSNAFIKSLWEIEIKIQSLARSFLLGTRY